MRNCEQKNENFEQNKNKNKNNKKLFWKKSNLIDSGGPVL